MPRVIIEINITADESEIEDALDKKPVDELLSDIGDSVVEIVNAKEGIYGTLNFYLNGEQESSVNFD